jgi:hypothetical protein
MRAFASVAGVLLLAACAHPWNTVNLPAGTTREEVIARAGQPIAVLPLPDGGQRLQYTLQPTGHYAFNVDVDANGRVIQSRQVLTQANFERIVPGQWRRDDVLREFGPPAEVGGVARWNGPVWTYRWRDVANTDMFYWVYFDPQGIVQRAHPGIEFRGPLDRLPL